MSRPLKLLIIVIIFFSIIFYRKLTNREKNPPKNLGYTYINRIITLKLQVKLKHKLVLSLLNNKITMSMNLTAPLINENIYYIIQTLP